VLKADSEATVLNGIANMSRAILVNVGYLVPETFHQSRILKLSASTRTYSSSKYLSSSVLNLAVTSLLLATRALIEDKKPELASEGIEDSVLSSSSSNWYSIRSYREILTSSTFSQHSSDV
jgi:hypothetical protein